MRVGIYTPVKDQASWIARVAIPDGAEWVVLDNASGDGSADAARRRGALVIENAEDAGRIGNWNACLRAFLDSDHDWLKWLFAGDELAPRAVAVLQEAIERHPGVRMIVGEYTIENRGVSRHWSSTARTQVIQPREALERVVREGNWLGSPVGIAIHRDAVEGLRFGQLEWAADFELVTRVASRASTLYLADLLGTFHTGARAFYQRHAMSPRADAEEEVVRRLALELLSASDGPDVDVHRLARRLRRSSGGLAAARRVMSGGASWPIDAVSAAIWSISDPAGRRLLRQQLSRR